MFKTNELIKVINLQKLACQSMLNGALVIEIVSSSFSESKKTSVVYKARNALIKKNEI